MTQTSAKQFMVERVRNKNEFRYDKHPLIDLLVNRIRLNSACKMLISTSDTCIGHKIWRKRQSKGRDICRASSTEYQHRKTLIINTQMKIMINTINDFATYSPNHPLCFSRMATVTIWSRCCNYTSKIKIEKWC